MGCGVREVEKPLRRLSVSSQHVSILSTCSLLTKNGGENRITKGTGLQGTNYRVKTDFRLKIKEHISP
jgi:hypothetical protein